MTCTKASLNYTLLNGQCVTEEIREEMSIPKINWKWKSNLSEPLAIAMVVLRGKFTSMSAYK